MSHNDKVTLLKDFEQMAMRCRSGNLEVLDQRLLPTQEVWLPVERIEQMHDYILQLAVRGAPLIGCAAALALAVHVVKAWPKDPDMVKVAAYIRSARPTAVNLMYAVDEILQLQKPEGERKYTPETVCEIAYKLMDDEIVMYERMSKLGADLIKDGDNILTHCNTGALATPGMGTALGVIREAHRRGLKIHVYVDETRPLLQGGRLTTYELQKENIPYTLICDNMAATLMRQGKIQRIFVGADRIAINGDFANKIGTYSVAVAAKYHNVPFHPVAPQSTVDFECLNGDQIPIEERKHEEVRGAFGPRWAPEECNTWNPAFDVTPGELVTSLILDSGVYDTAALRDRVLLKLKK